MKKILLLIVLVVALCGGAFCDNDNDRGQYISSNSLSSENTSYKTTQYNSFFYNAFYHYNFPLSDYSPPRWWGYSKVRHEKVGNFEVLTIPKGESGENGSKTYLIINGKIIGSFGGYNSK